jgi:outer membrane protein insertion porin family/translocation and assembly module TamA
MPDRATPDHHDAPRLDLRTFQGWRVVVVLGWILLSTACASRQPTVPKTEDTQVFPEVRQITLKGNTHFSSGTLRQLMATKQRPLLPPWGRGEPYNPPTLDADLLRLKKHYFDHGFLETSVRVDEVQEDTEKQTVRIVIALDEGPRTLVTAVALEGTIPPSLPPAAALLETLPLRPTQPLNKEAFDRSKTLLLTRLHDAGYARAQVIPRTEVDAEQHTATVTFTLAPGSETAYGQIALQGAQQVEEQAIRHQLTIHEGQRTSSDKALAASADAIYSLGMFQSVTPRALNPEAADEPLDVEFDLIERKPHALQFSVGYSTTEGFRGLVEWTHRNLFGGAQQFTLLARLSSIEQRGEVRLRLPYFLAERTAFTQTLFALSEPGSGFSAGGGVIGVSGGAHPAFGLLSVGAESRVEHRFTETLSGVVGLNFSRNEFRNVDTAALTAAEQEIAQDNTLFVQFAEVQYNTSDSFLNPTHGMVVRGRLEHSTTAVISDVSFVKLVLEARHYLPLSQRVLLATRLKLGGIEPYGASTDVPFNVRFFAGGPGSVRGFQLNRLGPVNADGDPIGGLSLIEGSAELRFPLFGDFGAVLFLDFGNVFSPPFTYHLGDLRYAVGPGLRYKTPVGPLRLDVGIIVDRRAGENFGRIEFSIGQAF